MDLDSLQETVTVADAQLGGGGGAALTFDVTAIHGNTATVPVSAIHGNGATVNVATVATNATLALLTSQRWKLEQQLQVLLLAPQVLSLLLELTNHC